MNEEEKQVRMAIMVGAAHAIKFKEKNWRATEQEILQHISENMDNILEHMDNPL